MSGPALPAHLLETLRVLADGWTRRQIAERLGLPEVTVKERLRALYEALGARNGVHAVAIGFRLGLLPVEREDDAA